jgi:MFS family permease
VSKSTTAERVILVAGHAPIRLRDPALAAFLGWLVPGLGHIYQRRTAKGVLFMISILGTFLYGLFLGEGHVVYASWRPEDRRLPYLCQVAVGLPALPALVQARRAEPLWNGFMAPPRDQHELDGWHRRLNKYFELGTVYTMIAGLLNVFAIYDAWGGPAIVDDEEDAGEPDRAPPKSGGEPPGVA